MKELFKKGKKWKVLTNKEVECLLPSAYRTAVFYYLPKIHKNKDHLPVRPIVNGIDGLCVHLEEYIDFYSQPLVEKTETFLKDLETSNPNSN